MFKNYFYLNRGIVELREKLIGKAIYEIYTQEKDQIFIRLESEHETFDHLILSCVPHLPYFLLRSDHRKAKKNTINFFDSFLPSKIVDLSIAENDRIIKIELEFSSLFFLIRGGSSNVVMFSEKTAEAFQKKEHATLAELHTEISKLNFIKGYNQAHFINPKSFEDLKNLRKSFPFVPKELIQNVGITAGEDESLISEEFQSSLKMILYQDIIIGELDGKTSFSPNNFVKHDGFNQKYILDNYNDAVQKFIQNYHYSGRKVKEEKVINHEIEANLEKLSNKINKLRNRLDQGSKESIYRRNGELLLANIYRLNRGMETVEVEDYNTGESVKVTLDTKLSPQKNIDKYFEKAKDEKINYEKSQILLEESQSKYNYYKDLENKLNQTDSFSDLNELKNQMGIRNSGKKRKMKDEISSKFRHFVLDGKYHVFVGRDGKSNDYLSIKFAKQNDYWFHARGLPGSHTMLRVDDPKEGIPKNIIKNAASIAAYFSKAKTAGTAPVSYTFAKFVTKKKGMDPGKVAVAKEKVLLVTPEIPKNAEQIEDE